MAHIVPSSAGSLRCPEAETWAVFLQLGSIHLSFEDFCWSYLEGIRGTISCWFDYTGIFQLVGSDKSFGVND